MRLTVSTFPALLSAVFLASLAVACAIDTPRQGPRVIEDIDTYRPPPVIHEGGTLDFEDFVEAIAPARAVAVGEVHDRFDHHLNQLEIIKRLHRRHPRLVIGMEQFQQPFQSWLDRYIDGSIDTGEMLTGTEYFTRWQYDYRLYDPILSYAREHGIPVVALNLSRELTRKAAAGGLDALSGEEAARVPELDRSDDAYRRRLRQVYEKHPRGNHGGSFENFYTAQLLWDEGMAARAAEYLREHPGVTMVVLAGEGHVEHGSGIPDRLARRIGSDVSTVVHRDEEDPSPGRADYIIDSRPATLPDRGMLGVIMDPGAESARIAELAGDSAAGAAGMKAGDVITAIDGAPVDGFAGLRVRLWDKRPGDVLTVTARRGDDTVRFDVALR